MADKESTLAIVLRTVDHATAGLRKFQEHIKGLGNGLFMLTAPARMFGERLGALAKEAGVPKLVEAFKGVGSAFGDLLGRLKDVGVGIGVGVGVAVAGVRALVDKFDGLGDTAERFGVSVDFLAQMRYAAERSGSSVEELDEGLKTFTAGLGQARAGTGKLAGFLQDHVSPVLLSQLKAAKSNEAAFGLMAKAMAKVTDPAKRAALAQKVFGSSALAPLLARGAKGIDELRARYRRLAGSQEDAAAGAGDVDDAMKDLGASLDGVEAALIAGIGPALTKVIERFSEWLGDPENRKRIKEWADRFANELPGAIDKLVAKVDWIWRKVDGFAETVGGANTVLLAVAGVIAGPLIASVLAFGAALMATPVGWIAAAITAVAAASGLAVYAIAKHWDGIKDFFRSVGRGIVDALEWAWGKVKVIADKVAHVVDVIKDAWHWLAGPGPGGGFSFLPKSAVGSGSLGAALAAASATTNDSGPASGEGFPFLPRRALGNGELAAALGAATTRPSEAKVTIDIANAPRGTRVTADPQSTADVDLSVGYQMGVQP